MVRHTSNYSKDRNSQENYNFNDKYDDTGESEFTRDLTVPFDENQVLSERHYSFGPLELHGRQRIRSREPKTEPSYKPDYRGRGPKGYERSDEKIKEDVSDALYRSSEVDASEIEVFVTKGIVTLKGTVNNRHQKRKAESTIENLAGVQDIFNEIHVKSLEPKMRPSPFGLTDNITGMN